MCNDLYCFCLYLFVGAHVRSVRKSISYMHINYYYLGVLPMDTRLHALHPHAHARSFVRLFRFYYVYTDEMSIKMNVTSEKLNPEHYNGGWWNSLPRCEQLSWNVYMDIRWLCLVFIIMLSSCNLQNIEQEGE